MATTKKGRRKGDPIPNVVLADDTDIALDTLRLQAAILAQRFGLLPATASTVAALAFAGVQR